MDSSLQQPIVDELSTSAITHGNMEEEEPHVHLPNPSLWPLFLSAAILLTIGGLLFIPDNPWLLLIAAPFVLICILGWGLEDPMAPLQEKFVQVLAPKETLSRFRIGQNVIDQDRKWLGTVQARFGDNYILVERGNLLTKTYYVPQGVAKSNIEKNIVLLSLSESELLTRGLNSVPDDLYQEQPEYGVPRVSGAAQFARGPLSPAQTGHYNYGRHWPGINTDASGSYHRDEVTPKPQRLVDDKIFTTDTNIHLSST